MTPESNTAFSKSGPDGTIIAPSVGRRNSRNGPADIDSTPRILQQLDSTPKISDRPRLAQPRRSNTDPSENTPTPSFSRPPALNLPLPSSPLASPNAPPLQSASTSPFRKIRLSNPTPAPVSPDYFSSQLVSEPEGMGTQDIPGPGTGLGRPVPLPIPIPSPSTISPLPSPRAANLVYSGSNSSQTSISSLAGPNGSGKSGKFSRNPLRSSSRNSFTAGMSAAEKRRYDLQMRVYKARNVVPREIPLRVFKKPEECMEETKAILKAHAER
jgi:hypothetical protein